MTVLDPFDDIADQATRDQAPKKPKRKRKPVDYALLVHPRTGRLTPACWILKEGFSQDVRIPHRRDRDGSAAVSDWYFARRVSALFGKGWLQEAKGPRGGDVYRTTPDGAFMMLLAEGVHGSKKINSVG